jgi:quinol monooxygenase YgiN
MATILAHIQVHPGRAADFEQVARELFSASSEEPGKRYYEYWRAATPGLYYCLLAFDDFHAFLEHQTSDHHETASPRLGELIENLKLEWVDPVEGASPLPATNSQPLAENADALTAQYHEMFAVESQDWWATLRKGDS